MSTLSIVRSEPVQAIVDALEHLLGDARSGRLRSLVYAGVRAPDTDVASAYLCPDGESVDLLRLIGAIELAKTRATAAMLARGREDFV